MFRFRTAFKHLVPSWLSTGDGELVLFSLGLIKDAFYTRILAGHESKFPSRTGPSGLKLIGDDRGFIQGRDESNANYAARLIRWRNPKGHKVRGSAFALLEQVSIYFGGVRCWTIDRNGNRHERDENAVETFSYEYAWNWDGAPASPRWARFWIVITPNPEINVTKHPSIDDPTLWDGATFDGATEVGVTLDQAGISAADVIAIKRLLTGRAWKPAGTRAEFAIIMLTDHNTTSPPAPDGTWGTWTGRDPAFGYWDLHA